ncbi:MAG: UDP-N-acetylmuramoyl-tripeptide--D-alanyl-D-alanine ligase [Candidatus Omnitrophota bacterium]
MFRLKELTEAVGARALPGDPLLRVSGVSIDSRTIKRGELFVAIKGSRFDGHNFIREAVKKGAAAIIGAVDSSRPTVGRKIPYIRVADTRRALGDLARFHRQRFNIPVIAVTGSNGKTTTKDMLAWILSSRIRVLKNEGTQNNDIGVPLTLLKLDKSCDAVVLELGTNHFGEIAYLSGIARPNFAVITNIGPVHLENLRSLAGVYKEKTALLKKLQPPRIAVLNADDSRLRKLKNNKRIIVISYGTRNQSDFNAARIRLAPPFLQEGVGAGKERAGFIEFCVNPASGRPKPGQRIRLSAVGCYNVYNALAAVAVSRLLGWSYRSISRCLGTFVFSSGRLRLVKSKDIAFLDDSYNANPVSFEEALSALSRFRVKGRMILVMGDMLELGKSAKMFHRRLGSRIAGVCDAFIGVGNFSKFTAEEARKSGMDKDRIFTCENSAQARDLLFGTLKPFQGDLILVKGSRLMKMELVLRFKR